MKLICSELIEHTTKLPGVKLNELVEFTGDIEYSLYDTEIVLLVVPSSNMRGYCWQIPGILKDRIIVSCSKGIEDETGYRMSQIIEEETQSKR